MDIRCFVAMAFDHADTDRIYQAINKALKRGAAVPGIGTRYRILLVRIDKIEYNDDIDDRIIREIEDADFVIADLTYARPSVYFEAGYAQRRVPVVYTCRGDHFRPDVSDTYGNRRVHFDLQMKNIIPWREPGDAIFCRRLASRVRKVIVPIIREKRAQAEDEEARKAFLRLPLQQRVSTLLDFAASTLHRASYVSCRDPEGIQTWLSRNVPSAFRSSAAGALCQRIKRLTAHTKIFVGRRDHGRVSRHVAVLVAESLTASVLGSVRDVMVAAAPWDCRLALGTSPDRIDDTLVLCSLSPVPGRRVSKVLPDFGPDSVDALIGNRQLPLPAVPVSGELANVVLPEMRYAGERDGAVVLHNDGRSWWAWDSYMGYAISSDGETVDKLPMRMTDRRVRVHLVSNITSLDDFEKRLGDLALR